ncbi:hypothetical protein SNEBB_001838 [Seison nebaliae]|nr:hypothetical protein SNEBB_001838 [Seison nebaliae]
MDENLIGSPESSPFKTFASQGTWHQERNVSLTWENLGVKTKSKKSLCRKIVPSKQILSNVSGCVKSGQMLAILGASGSGKTTLLNTLNLRNSSDLVRIGNIRLNCLTATQKMMGKYSSYVEQDDMFVGELTVREHLRFHSALRLDQLVSRIDQLEYVEELIADLGLTLCQNTLIGNRTIKGISGGEMKRLSLATELLSDPSILFCDEPTSGLDSFLASTVVKSLLLLARRGMTIVCTIHQPSSAIFQMFDQLMLLANGRCVYFGNANAAIPFFSETYGKECPISYNPAEFLLEEFALKPGQEQKCITDIDVAFEKYDNSQRMMELKADIANTKDLTSNSVELRRINRKKSSMGKELGWLLWRSFFELIRQPFALRMRIMQAAFIGLLLGFIFFQLTINQTGIQNFNGISFVVLTNLSFSSMFAVVNTITGQIPLFMRERRKKVYGIIPFFTTKAIVNMVLTAIITTIFATIIYWTVGFYSSGRAFGLFVIITNLVAISASGFGMFISCLASSIEVALALSAPMTIPLMLFGGLFLNNSSTPIYFIWIKYVSWFKYGYDLICTNQWENIKTIPCPANTTTCFHTGEQVLHSLSMDDVKKWKDFTILAALGIGLHLVGLLVLAFRLFLKKR